MNITEIQIRADAAERLREVAGSLLVHRSKGVLSECKLCGATFNKWQGSSAPIQHAEGCLAISIAATANQIEAPIFADGTITKA